MSGAAVLSPRGVAFSPEGLLYVSDTEEDWLLRIDPYTGEAVWVYDFTAPTIADPEAMLADDESGWDILVLEADQRRIHRIDPVTGQNSVEFQLVGTRFPIGLARDPDGTLVVADRFADPLGKQAGIYRVDVGAGTQTAVSRSDDFLSLRRVAVQSDGDILVTDRGLSGGGRRRSTAWTRCTRRPHELQHRPRPSPARTASRWTTRRRHRPRGRLLDRRARPGRPRRRRTATSSSAASTGPWASRSCRRSRRATTTSS